MWKKEIQSSRRRLHWETRHIFADHGFKQNDPRTPLLLLSLRGRKADDPRQNRRHLHRCKLQIFSLSPELFFRFLRAPQNAGPGVLLAAEQNTQIQRFIADQRERAAGVRSHRRNYRVNFGFKQLVQILFFIFRQPFPTVYPFPSW